MSSKYGYFRQFHLYGNAVLHRYKYSGVASPLKWKWQCVKRSHLLPSNSSQTLEISKGYVHNVGQGVWCFVKPYVHYKSYINTEEKVFMKLWKQSSLQNAISTSHFTVLLDDIIRLWLLQTHICGLLAIKLNNNKLWLM